MEATEQLNLPSANCIAVTLRAPVGDEGWYSLGSKEGWWLLAGCCHHRQMCGWAVEEPPDVCIHREMRHLQKLQRSSSGSSLEGVMLQSQIIYIKWFSQPRKPHGLDEGFPEDAVEQAELCELLGRMGCEC